MEVQVRVFVRRARVCVAPCVFVLVMVLHAARCGLSLTHPPVMCEHVRGRHQATPMFPKGWKIYILRS